VNKLAATYFRGAYRPTIIGATAFHFRVRDGNGWFRCAMTTRRLISDELSRVSDDWGELRFPDNCIQGLKRQGGTRRVCLIEMDNARQTDD
jgi:hypothetical protein